MAKWFVLRQGKEDGPLSSDELRRLAASGALKPHDVVRSEDMELWAVAAKVKGLFEKVADPKVFDAAVVDEPPSPQDGVAPLAPILATPVGPPSLPPPQNQLQASDILTRAKAWLTEFTGTAKQAGQLAAAHARKTHLTMFTLPNAYSALGERVFGEGLHRQEFSDSFAAIESVRSQLASLVAATPAPPHSGVKEMLSSGATRIKEKGQAATLKMQQSKLFRELGQKVFDLHGPSASCEQTVATAIVEGRGEVERLDAEITRLSQAKSHFLSPRRLVIAATITFSMLMMCCCGIGTIGNMVGPPKDVSPDETATQNNSDIRADKPKRIRYLDLSGKIVIDLPFDYADSFSEGLALVKRGQKYGFIDKSGSVVIDIQFDRANSFSEGLACVRKDDKSFCIDKSGAKVFDLPVSWGVLGFSSGVGCLSAKTGLGAYAGVQYGVIDKTGKIVVKPQFDLMSSFRNGRAVVLVKGLTIDSDRSGIIDTNGQFVVPLTTKFHFGNLGSGMNTGFSDGLVGYIDKFEVFDGYVDTEGKIVIPATRLRCSNAMAGQFSDGLARVTIGMGRAIEPPPSFMQVGYIDRSGQWVIEPRFYNARDFSDGLAAVQERRDDKFGYIDRTGQMVLEPQFDPYSQRQFKQGLAPVAIDGKWGVIDKQGKFVVEAKYGSINEYSEGLAAVID